MVLACEPAGHRWKPLVVTARAGKIPVVCVQPLLVRRAREGEDLLRRALQLYSFPAITRNAEYERPQDSTGNIEGTDYLFCCSGSLRMISFGREAFPHSYLADTGPD